jgi:geranylgeranyl pyrophosphate synthase
MEEDLAAFFAVAKGDFESNLNNIIDSHHERSKLEYFLRGGKRLRPMLCLLSYRACGGNDAHYQDALDLAAAIELQHSASLVHDDIIDGDMARRGSSSYYKAYGVEDAILIGHKAIVLGFKTVLGHDPKIIATLFDIWDESLRGETEEVEARKNKTLMETGGSIYFDIILKKTASLFAGAALVGVQEAGANRPLQDVFWEYGKYIGLAYQLVDDMKDLDSGKEMLSLAWVLGQMDEDLRRSFAERMEVGALPSRILADLGIDAQNLFLGEIAKMQQAAEDIAGGKRIPESEFKPLLQDFPGYITKKCMVD